MTRNYSNKLSGYIHENGGRVILLFLLFILAIYEFIHSGLNTFALVCLSPILVIVIYVAFTWRMFVFYLLLVVNWFIQFKNISIPIPTSLANEGLELILIGIAIIDARKETYFSRANNIMYLAILIWFGLCFIEIFNNTCGLGYNLGAWFQGFRLMGLQLLWILLVFSLYITNPKSLIIYLRIWAALSLFSVYWTWKMIHYGFTDAENAWLNSGGAVTHIINGGTLTRYWSTFSDAANYGCNASASAIAFLIFGITSKIRKDKIFFLLLQLQSHGECFNLVLEQPCSL